MAPARRATMPTLDPEELAQLLPAESAAFASPIPTRFVSSDEFMPLPQTGKQREVAPPTSRKGRAAPTAATAT
jgi:hypothetical protein